MMGYNKIKLKKKHQKKKKTPKKQNKIKQQNKTTKQNKTKLNLLASSRKGFTKGDNMFGGQG